ncbi:hypothetical protein F4809DRAFT_555065 [Biscogniauxia mediterranea]|nr:hypothetical protein F4809DRAFT_555065 [Biscogniauxia mediterranea]
MYSTSYRCLRPAICRAQCTLSDCPPSRQGFVPFGSGKWGSLTIVEPNVCAGLKALNFKSSLGRSYFTFHISYIPVSQHSGIHYTLDLHCLQDNGPSRRQTDPRMRQKVTMGP